MQMSFPIHTETNNYGSMLTTRVDEVSLSRQWPDYPTNYLRWKEPLSNLAKQLLSQPDAKGGERMYSESLKPNI